ncbi:MAG: hypothetical protein GY936_02900 [Ignavibacteriae bacterium]|nr:hypothetical protein [Ignavibacteriota bacterium]
MISWIKSMSYIKFLIFVAIMILLFSCDINDIFNDEDEDEKEEVRNTIEVGPSGGTINVDDISISIPPGSFAEVTNIKISSVPNTGDDADIVTRIYSVEGIPTQFSKPIDISIKHSGNISDKSYLIVQEESYIPSLGGSSVSNNYFEAIISGDSIKCQIPAKSTDLAKVVSAVDINDDSVWKLVATTRKKNHTTSNNHFNIVYSSNKDNISDIIALGQFLEDAYTKIQGLGFSYSRRTTWPVQVSIENLANADYGLFNASYWSYNRDYMRFNRIHLSDQIAMKTTAIHEFFHLVQYLYDSRFAFNRAGFQSPQHWFNEACAVWSEELVTNSKYISSTKGSFTAKSPFKGLHAGSEIDVSEHGYGMSAFVKYIVGKYGQNVLVNIYDKLFAGGKVVDAINKSMDEMLFIDYNLFLQQYAHGQLYPDVGLPTLLDILEDEFEIKTDSDTLKTFTANYRELSGKIYSVKLDNPNLKDDASLEISIDEELCHITVFQYPEPNSPYNVIAEGGKSCIVPDLKGLKAINKRLLVMVTNSNLIKIPSYSPSSKNITVKMKVKGNQEVLTFTKVCFDWALENRWSNRTDYLWQEWGFCFSPIVLELAKSGNTYSGSFEGHSWWNPGSAYSGSITFTLRDNENTVTLNGQTNLATSVEFTFKNTRDESVMWYDYIITMTDVEYSVKSNGDLGFYVSGIETCDHITFATNDVDSFGTHNYVVDYNCQAGSRMSIGFNND